MTPEEQEKIRKSKDPSVSLAAFGTTHTTEEAKVFIRHTLAEKIVRGNRVIRIDVIQASHHSSSRMGMGKLRVKPSMTFPWLSQACKEPITRPVLLVTGSIHELWATTSSQWKRNYLHGFNH